MTASVCIVRHVRGHTDDLGGRRDCHLIMMLDNISSFLFLPFCYYEIFVGVLMTDVVI